MIKRPGNEFNITDFSGGVYNSVRSNVVAPLMMIVSSFDKGDERFMEISGDDFFRMFGENISYERHGQPIIQAANVIRNGGKLLVKRAVANDATLANAVILATVKQTQVPKVDPETGEPIYIDSISGTETTEENSVAGKNDRAVINNATIKYSVTSIEGAKTMAELQSAAKALIVENDPLKDSIGTGGSAGSDGNTDAQSINTDVVSDSSQVPSSLPGEIPLPVGALGPEGEEYEYTYPIFIIADNGRGVSSKRFMIEPDYALSKNAKFILFKLTNIGSLNLDSEYIRFSADPDRIYRNQSMSLSESGKGMIQLQPAVFNEGLYKFIDKVSEFSGIEKDTLLDIDFLFGRNARGEKIPQISVDEDGWDLTSVYGIPLSGGSNGSFGDKPFGTQAYTDRLVEIFTDALEENTDIFDVEQWKIEVCVDANYPMEVKKVITELADFRKDFFYFRDLGLNVNSYDTIKFLSRELGDTMYAANYCQSYDIIDPFSLKQIPVTIGYSIARLLINHLNNARHCPFNGELYSVNIPEAIEGTVNYIPRIKPKIDQKQQIYDLHMNYATYVNGILTLETQINSQTEETQCSWINNILLIQQVIREIRIQCPKSRYSFIDTTVGLSNYAQDVNNILNSHNSEFEAIEFEYSSDEIELANHIFNATINVAFKDYVDYEKFTICVFD